MHFKSAIAIIDAYGSPDAAADLATLSTQFGLPACTTAKGCFIPQRNTGWEVEINTSELSDLYAAAVGISDFRDVASGTAGRFHCRRWMGFHDWTGKSSGWIAGALFSDEAISGLGRLSQN